jgi:hypothetical protein
VARRQRCHVDAGIVAGMQSDIRWPVSCGHRRCRESATYVLGPERCEPPDGRRRSKSEPGCAVSSPAVRGSRADRIRGAEKSFCCVTTRGDNFRVLNGLGRGLDAQAARLLSLGVLGFDHDILATFRLSASRVPATDLPLTFRVLAVALVPGPRLVPASASFAQAATRARAARPRQTSVALRNVEGAHGSGNSQGKSSGWMPYHSPRALSKRDQHPFSPVYRVRANQTPNQTLSSIAPRKRRARNRCRSNDRRLANKTARKTVSSTRC